MELPTISCQVVTRTDASSMISSASHSNGNVETNLERTGVERSGEKKSPHLCVGENMSEKLHSKKYEGKGGMSWNPKGDVFGALTPVECGLLRLPEPE